jgi:hypothetical protein
MHHTTTTPVKLRKKSIDMTFFPVNSSFGSSGASRTGCERSEQREPALAGSGERQRTGRRFGLQLRGYGARRVRARGNGKALQVQPWPVELLYITELCDKCGTKWSTGAKRSPKG